MTDKPKSIQEALVEMQRRINEAQKAKSAVDWTDASSYSGSTPEPAAEPKAPSAPKPASTPKPAAAPKAAAAKPGVLSTIGKTIAKNPKTALAGAAIAAGTAALGSDGIKKVKNYVSDVVGLNKTPEQSAASLDKAAEKVGISSPATPASSTPAATSDKTPSTSTAPAPTADTKTETKPKPMSFSQAFKSAREKATAAGKPSTGQFEFQGKKYQTNIKGEKYVPMSKQSKVDAGSTTSTAKPAATPSSSAPLPPRRPDDLGKVNAPTPPRRPSDLPKPTASGLSVPTIGTVSGKYNPDKERSARLSFQAPDAEGIAKTKWVGRGDSAYKAEKPEAFDDNRLDPSTTSGNAEFPMSDKFVRTEPKKKVNEMSEETNPLIAAFLKLQDENPSNMFEAAKKAKKDYDKDGKVESPKDEVWGSRFAAAKKAGKMEEAAVDAGSVEGSKSVTKDKPKEDPSTPKSYPGAASSLTPDNPTTKRMSNAVKEEEEVEIEEGRTTGNRSYKGSPDRKRKAVQMALGRKHKDHPDWNERTSPQYSALKLGRQLQKQGVKEEEEVTFTQEEIDHINSFFLEASVAPVRPETTEANPTSEKLSQNDLTATAESGKKKIEEKLTDEAKAKVRTALSDKMKKSSAPARALIKLAKSNPANVKEEAEELEEGRPKKNPTPETSERDPRKHIQVEAGRAAAGSVVDFHHNDGSKSKITPAMGRKITSHLQGLKPADRQAAVNKMHDSAEGLKV